jgi:hypothetical protein
LNGFLEIRTAFGLNRFLGDLLDARTDSSRMCFVFLSTAATSAADSISSEFQKSEKH